MKNTVQFNNKTLVPSKIICVGRNYIEHIAELNNEVPSEPVIFVKPNSAISRDLYTHAIDTIHYECEICFIIENDKFSAVGLGLDLTKRSIQNQLKKKGLPWERAKAFDKSAVFSEFVDLPVEPSNLHMSLHINEQLVQEGGYLLMLNKPENLLRNIHSFMSTENGDILMTGTPKGVGIVTAGSLFEASLYVADELLLSHTWKAI